MKGPCGDGPLRTAGRKPCVQRLVPVLALAFVLSGCAQRLPAPQDGGGGLAALPTKSVMNVPFGSFVYSYVFSGSIPEPFELRIYPAVGRDFSFSRIYPAGDYLIDTLTMYGTPSATITPELYRRSERLADGVKVRIKDGGVTMVDILFTVTVRAVDQETFTTTRAWQPLDEGERRLWLERLQAMGNSDSWTIVD